MASFTKLKANKKTIASLKVVAAWLVIVAMLIEAPLTLYVYAQQGYLGSETVQDAPPNLPYIGDEDVIALDEPAAAVANPVAYLEETLLFLEEERDYLVAELNRLDEMQTDVENYLNQQVIRLSNQQFALQQEINDLGRTALANELTSELNELTA
ncbi:MAG: hypothetical protein FWC32_02020, partial [Firmicutes bacterium]|nr:hypothetical protein [Bacillota bacterium]